jgi:plastocyanin
MRFAAVIGAGAVLAVLAACGSNSIYGGGGCTPTATEVCMVGTTFTPGNRTVAAGTTVTWRNGSGISHTVTSATGSGDTYDSGSVPDGSSFSHQFMTPGTYPYYCQFHGVNGTPPTGMHGTITVN